MADAVASPLIRMLSDRLEALIDAGLEIPDPAIGSSRFLRMLPARLRHLMDRSWVLKDFQLTLAELQALVVQAENRSEDAAALLHRCWLSMVKDAVYEANDILDEFLFSRLYKPLKFTFQLEMESSFGRLRNLIRRRRRITLPLPAATHRETSKSCSRRATEAFPWKTEITVFGLENDQEMLARELMTDEDGLLKAIPIVGMAGLGKTTLAQLVFNSPKVRAYFDLTQWIHVGQSFDVETIVREVTGSTNRFLESLDRASSNLSERRILIVLDDVWDEDQEKWRVLLNLLLRAAGGSAVMVTTRNERVATLLGTLYSPKLLSGDHSWSLFEWEAFGSTNVITKMESTKQRLYRRLVAKCEGLPLAIKALAMVVRCSGEEETRWLLGKNDDPWNLPGFESSVLPSLKLSYDDLPSHLKQCFAFCSIFPKGYAIGKDQLVQLWIAQGFVPMSDASRSPEDIANYYFMQLLHRSFFVQVMRDDRGEIVKCRLHDLIHDLAQHVAGIGCKILENATLLPSVAAEIRHCSLLWNSDLPQPTISELLPHKAKRLRTLILFSSNLQKIPGFLFKLRCLHSLDLSEFEIQTLSESIGNLIHLRYLNLSRTLVRKLPSSLGRLRSLYTLQLAECFMLQKLPNSICKLTNLRHLNILSCYLLSHMPPHIKKLRNLQELPLFIASNIDGCSHIDELRELDLRGELEIKNLEHVSSPEDARRAELFDKQNLRSLKLSWNGDSYLSDEVLENLKPPGELEVLRIAGYGGIRYPSWLSSSFLQTLASLSLINCSCKEVPPLGQLPNLEYLYMKEMLALEVIDNEFYGGSGSIKGFPSLKRLDLYDMPELKEWWGFDLEGEELAFPCLKSLTIVGCWNLSRIPVVPNLEKLALRNCNGMLLLSLQHQKSLSSLVISDCRDKWPMALGNLYSIRNMTLYRCDGLLSQLADGMEGFLCLQHLRILYCEELESLPTGLRDLTSLRWLEIVDCPKLAYVPDILDVLYHLEELVIDGCPMLTTLPSSITRTNLQKLAIQRCPELRRQLLGEEWSKIAHIPSIEMNLEDQASEERIEEASDSFFMHAPFGSKMALEGEWVAAPLPASQARAAPAACF